MPKGSDLRFLLLSAFFACMVVSGCTLQGSGDIDDLADNLENVGSCSSKDDDGSSSSQMASSSSSQMGNSSSYDDSATYDKKNNTMTDHRTGRTYRTVKLDGKIWMAENMYTSRFCYDDDEANCEKYGSLGASCPSGWHVPSKDEWESMFEFVGGADSAGYYLKSKTGWEDGANGIDKFGFTVLPGGYSSHRGYGSYYEDTYVLLGTGTKFESSTRTSGFAPYRVVFNQELKVDFAIVSKYDEVYTRCIKDYEDGDIEIKFGSMTDPRDGKTYRTEPIGEYTIMVDCLRYTGVDPSNPDSVVDPGCNRDSTRCSYRNVVAVQGNFSSYYVQGLCPSGWHIPSIYEIDRMDEILEEMFSSSYEREHYLYPDTGYSGFYSSTVRTYVNRNGMDTLWREQGNTRSVRYAAIRCVKDDPAKYYGEVVDSRDGNIYRTIKIGNTEWMADNLNYKAEDSYCVFQDSTELFEDGDSCTVYGRYYCQENIDGLCMKGWRVPNQKDIEELTKYYPEESHWMSTSHWSLDQDQWENTSNASGMNGAGLDLLPTGYIQRDTLDQYMYYGKRVDFRLDSVVYEWFSSAWIIVGDTLTVYRTPQNRCYPIRCVRD